MRIGLVHDDPTAAEGLRRAVTSVREHEVIWIAPSVDDAVTLAGAARPDVVLMGPAVAGISSAEATRRIMMTAPCPILIVTATLRADAGFVFDAIGEGALDAVDLPAAGPDEWRENAAPLLAKIATVSRLLRSVRKPGREDQRPEPARPRGADQRLIAIGASAGGPPALATLLGALPLSLGAAIVVVQHVEERFALGLADWLSRSSARQVRLAADGDMLSPDTVLVAGTGQHLVLRAADSVGYTAEPETTLYRPSVDVFFSSVSLHWPGKAVGVLLTGMGRDGAVGLRAMRNRGHYTIAQDETTSAVYGMPKEAVALGAATAVLPVDRIAARVIQLWNAEPAVTST